MEQVLKRYTNQKCLADNKAVTKSENVDAPIINESPICLKYEFIEYGECDVIGKVVNVT